ncbi:MAG: thiol:disulfide interchange protein, partial [Bacteroidaceae bacterium]|nr:thiol:disulfide interchange protein [Bacteroidaceae bacterium]
MSKLYLFIMLFSFLGLNLSAQIQEPVRFTVEQKKTGAGELEIRFKADIDEGWHVYGPENAEGGPTVATLTLENSKGVELKGGLKVDGQVHRAMDEMFEMEVTYVEGEASFVQTLAITEPAYEVSGYLTYGACSDQNCMPPTDVEFSFKGQSEAVADPAAKTTENEMRPEENKIPSGGKISEGHENWWKPVVEELQSFGQDEQAADNTLWGIFLLGFLGGFVALFTPCVWPIIPMTVSFFLKRSQDKRKGVRDAVLYGVSIVVIYVLLGLLVTMIFGASALNALSTNAVFNIFFFLMLLFFAASFLGGFEITLPSKWTNAVDKKSESTT